MIIKQENSYGLLHFTICVGQHVIDFVVCLPRFAAADAMESLSCDLLQLYFPWRQKKPLRVLSFICSCGV